MKKKLLVATIPLVSAVMFSGCATLFGGGGEQTISINSDTSKRLKAEIVYEDNSNPQYVTLPATIKVKRKSKNIIIKSPDNEFQEVTVEKKTNPWFWGDIIATSPLSTTTDAITGSMWKYDETVTVHDKK